MAPRSPALGSSNRTRLGSRSSTAVSIALPSSQRVRPAWGKAERAHLHISYPLGHMSLASLFDILVDFLTEDGWAPEPLPGESMARFRVRGENGEWDAFVQAREADQQI